MAALPALCVPQDPSSPLSTGIRPQAIVQVSETKVGADLITITVLDADYPPKLLQSQAEAIGRNVGGGSRGVQVFQEAMRQGDSKSSLWKATFAVDGIIDSTHHIMRLGPIASGLAGVPAPHTLNQFFIDFDRASVGPMTIGDFSSPSVRIKQDVEGVSVEYAVELLSQDPRLIVIPDSKAVPGVKVAAAAPSAGGKTDWVVLGASIVGALAAAALVYSLLLVMLRPTGKKRTRP